MMLAYQLITEVNVNNKVKTSFYVTSNKVRCTVKLIYPNYGDNATI